MTFWRDAGLKFSNIAAKMIRRSLKAEFRVDAAKREDSSVRFTQWADGKPAKPEK